MKVIPLRHYRNRRKPENETVNANVYMEQSRDHPSISLRGIGEPSSSYAEFEAIKRQTPARMHAAQNPYSSVHSQVELEHMYEELLLTPTESPGNNPNIQETIQISLNVLTVLLVLQIIRIFNQFIMGIIDTVGN